MFRRLSMMGIVVAGLAAAPVIPAAAAAGPQGKIAPAGQADISLSGVSCADPAHCLAVGQRTAATDPGSDVAQAWNGRSWRMVPVPSPGVLAGLGGVACTAPAACIAVGGYATAAGPARALAMSWDGSGWTVLPVPGPDNSEFRAISCSAPRSCVAVGDFLGTGRRATLAEAWNGTRWRVLSAANTHSADSVLGAVWCGGPGSCLGVGTTRSPADITVSLAERWNGTRWTIDATASPGNELNVLSGVSCAPAPGARTRAAICVAGGYYLNRGQAFAAPLADKWTGARWVPFKPRDPGRGGSLLSVSCASPSGCMFVGGQFSSSGGPLAEAWNGTAWRVVPTADLGSGTGNLVAISCPRPSRCMAAGEEFTGSGPARPLAEQWDGVRWRVTAAR